MRARRNLQGLSFLTQPMYLLHVFTRRFVDNGLVECDFTPTTAAPTTTVATTTTTTTTTTEARCCELNPVELRVECLGEKGVSCSSNDDCCSGSSSLICSKGGTTKGTCVCSGPDVCPP